MLTASRAMRLRGPVVACNAHRAAALSVRAHPNCFMPRAPMLRAGPAASRPLVVCRAEAADEESDTLSGLSDGAVAELRAKFELADKDGNGVIDKDELKQLLESTAGGKEEEMRGWMSAEEVDRYMARYDIDESGAIDFEEFSVLIQDDLLLQGKIEEYKAAFDLADTKVNGKLSAIEIAALFKSMGSPISFGELTNVMAKYDVDESGQLDFGEFLKMFRDKLLDLEAVLKFANSDRGTVLEHPNEGEVLLIFSEEELYEVLDENKDGLVVVNSALTWCRPCKAVQRPFQKMAVHYPDVKFVKFYGNSNQSTKKIFREIIKARATPAFSYFRDGKIVRSHTGASRLKLEKNVREEVGGELPEVLFEK